MSHNISICTVCQTDKKSSKQILYKEEAQGNLYLHQCNKCHTVYLGEYSQDFDTDLYNYYTKYNDMEEHLVYDVMNKNQHHKWLDLFTKHTTGNNILDVGCGHGGFVKSALEFGWNAVGIELSQAAIDIGRKFNLPIQNLDFFSEEIAKSTQDIILMSELIEHVPNPGAFLSRAEQVVKPGGLVYLTTPNFNSLDRRILGAQWDPIHREHLTYFTQKSLAKLVYTSTHFKIISAQTKNISTQLIKQVIRIGKAHNSQPTQRKPTQVSRDEVRDRVESSKSLKLLKTVANGILNATSLGSTITLLLKRPE